MGQIKKTLLGNNVYYVNDNGHKSKAYKNIEETFNIHEGEGEYLCVNNATGVINKNCKEIVKPNVNNELILFNDFIIVKDTSKLGKSNSVKIVDLNGNIIKTFDNISKVGDFYSVVKDGKFGLLDGNGVQIFECYHSEEIKPLENYAFLVDGKKRLPSTFKNDKFTCINNSKYIVENNNKFGLLDYDLSVILDVKYDSIVIVDDKVYAKLNGKLGIYNLNGEMLVDHKLETENDSLNFSEGLAVFVQNGKYGYVNDKLECVIKPEYAMAGDFKRYNNNKPYAKVYKEGPDLLKEKNGLLCGLITNDGEVKVTIQYVDVEPIIENLAMVRQWLVRRENNCIWPKKSKPVEFVEDTSNYLYDMGKQDVFGDRDSNAVSLTPFYQADGSNPGYIRPFKMEYEDGYYKIYASDAYDKNGRYYDYGLFDQKGNCVINFFKTNARIYHPGYGDGLAEINEKVLAEIKTIRAEYRKKHSATTDNNVDGGQDQGDGVGVKGIYK